MPDFWKLLGDGKCSMCGGPLGAIFRRIRMDIGVINVRNVKHLMAMSEITGSPTIADVLSPYQADRDYVKFTGNPDDMAAVDPQLDTAMQTYHVCNDCYARRLPVQLLEPANSVEGKIAKIEAKNRSQEQTHDREEETDQEACTEGEVQDPDQEG